MRKVDLLGNPANVYAGKFDASSDSKFYGSLEDA